MNYERDFWLEIGRMQLERSLAQFKTTMERNALVVRQYRIEVDLWGAGFYFVRRRYDGRSVFRYRNPVARMRIWKPIFTSPDNPDSTFGVFTIDASKE